jgi:hypothetical protein
MRKRSTGRRIRAGLGHVAWWRGHADGERGERSCASRAVFAAFSQPPSAARWRDLPLPARHRRLTRWWWRASGKSAAGVGEEAGEAGRREEEAGEQLGEMSERRENT